jgi:presenilin-like A22 family membrane protease
VSILIFFVLSAVIGGLVGYIAERFNIIDRTVIAAVVTGAGGAVAGFMVLTVASVPITYRVFTAVAFAILALWMLPGRGK